MTYEKEQRKNTLNVYTTEVHIYIPVFFFFEIFLLKIPRMKFQSLAILCVFLRQVSLLH
jgi:hypothetical protein